MGGLLSPATIAATASAASRAGDVAAATPEQAAQTGLRFEQMFLAQMLTPVFDAIDTGGMFGGGSAEKMLRSFQVDAFAGSIVAKGGIGLAQDVAREILRMQEKTNG
jgi:Rod binding domain-containing protein